MPRRSGVGVGVTLLVVLGACAPSGQSGLRVRGYSADLVFSADARPAVVPPGAGAGPTLGQDGRAFLPDDVADRAFAKYSGPPLAAHRTCPDAPVGAAALEQAPPVVPVDRRPPPGSYRWKRAGTQTVTALGTRLDIAGFEPRTVAGVRELGDGDFTYATTSLDLAGRTSYTYTWQVKPEALQDREGALTASVVVGDPERGLTVKAIATRDATGKVTGSFRPVTGLLVLPLPVVPGEQFVSVAVDPDTLQSAQYRARVVKRDRIDACGDYVEGWQVEGTLTFSNGAPYEWDVLVATQMGALVVSEHLVGQNTVGPYDVTVSLGQAGPS